MGESGEIKIKRFFEKKKITKLSLRKNDRIKGIQKGKNPQKGRQPTKRGLHSSQAEIYKI